MTDLPFHLDWVQALADNRQPWLTAIMQAFTFSGEIQGYVLLVALVYATYDKRLAVRLALLTLLAMTLNHALKTLIGNPRPFITEGTYLQKWAVSPARAADLATEYSTPSGHAMAAGAFYGTLCLATDKRGIRVLFVLCMLLVGLSRPYLGVHYFEDVASGWVLGLAVVFGARRIATPLARAWDRRALGWRAALLGGASLVLWLMTRGMSDWQVTAPPTAFISYAGLLSGILVALPLEARYVDFDPRSGALWQKLLRYLAIVAMTLGTLTLLDVAFDALQPESIGVQHALRFLRYAAAGMAGLYLAPLLCTRVGLATRLPPPGPSSLPLAAPASPLGSS